MKNRLYLILGALLLAAVGWAAWQALRPLPREPVYDEKPLSYWLTNGSGNTIFSGRLTPAETEEPPFSMRERYSHYWPQSLIADPNAVPLLIKALKRDGWILAAYYRKRVWPTLPAAIKHNLPPPPDNLEIRRGAANVLLRMGPMAKPAVPTLIRAFKEEDDAYTKLMEAETLRRLGGAGNSAFIAEMTEALKDNNRDVRWHATNYLWRLDPEAAARAGVKKPPP